MSTVYVVLTREHFEGDTLEGIYGTRAGADNRRSELAAAGQCGVLIVAEIPLNKALTVNLQGEYEVDANAKETE